MIFVVCCTPSMSILVLTVVNTGVPGSRLFPWIVYQNPDVWELRYIHFTVRT